MLLSKMVFPVATGHLVIYCGEIVVESNKNLVSGPITQRVEAP